MKKFQEFKVRFQQRVQSDFDYAKSVLLYLYSCQTRSERKNLVNVVQNNVGFCRNDTARLTNLAIQIKMRKELTQYQVQEVCGKVAKYARQAAEALRAGNIPSLA